MKHGAACKLSARIGRAAKAARLRKGLTLRAVAERIDITHVHLCNIENGKSDVSLRVVELLSDFYRVDLTAQ